MHELIVLVVIAVSSMSGGGTAAYSLQGFHTMEACRIAAKGEQARWVNQPGRYMVTAECTRYENK